MSEAKELASILNGRQYGSETTDALRVSANEAGLIIIFGASDDLCEIEGYLSDEISCNNGGEILFDKGELYQSRCEGEDCVHEIKIQDNCKRVEILWYREEPYSWTYKTNIPHETFDIFEGVEKYCRGIIIDVKDLL